MDITQSDLAQNSSPVAGSSEYGNKPSVFTKGNESPYQCREFQLFKQSSLISHYTLALDLIMYHGLHK
jgi:hypothetical protein